MLAKAGRHARAGPFSLPEMLIDITCVKSGNRSVNWGLTLLHRGVAKTPLFDLRCDLEESWEGTTFDVAPVISKAGRASSKDRPFFVCPTLSDTVMPIAMTHESKWKSRAIEIEYWLLSALVGGSFIAGLLSAIRTLAGD